MSEWILIVVSPLAVKGSEGVCLSYRKFSPHNWVMVFSSPNVILKHSEKRGENLSTRVLPPQVQANLCRDGGCGGGCCRNDGTILYFCTAPGRIGRKAEYCVISVMVSVAPCSTHSCIAPTRRCCVLYFVLHSSICVGNEPSRVARRDGCLHTRSNHDLLPFLSVFSFVFVYMILFFC